MKILFLVQIPQIFDTFKKLIDLTIVNFDVEIDIMAGFVCAGVKNTDNEYLKNCCIPTEKFLYSYGYKSIPMYEKNGLADVSKYDYVFLQTPYCIHRPAEWAIEKLSELTNVAYIPYGYGLSDHPEYQIDLDFYKHCKKIYCDSKYLYDSFKLKYPGSDAKNKFVLTGSPKVDALLDSNPDEGYWNLKKNINIKRVIWAPHWTLKWETNAGVFEGFSQFLKYSDFFMGLLHGNTNIDFVLRAHPMMWNNLVSSNIWSTNMIESFVSEINGFENARVDDSSNYLGGMLGSDALITDGISFLAEYAPTYKPIIYTQNINGPGLNIFGNDLVKNYYVAKNVAELEEYFNDVILAGSDSKLKYRCDDINNAIVNVRGGVCSAIITDLLSSNT